MFEQCRIQQRIQQGISLIEMLVSVCVLATVLLASIASVIQSMNTVQRGVDDMRAITALTTRDEQAQRTRA